MIKRIAIIRKKFVETPLDKHFDKHVCFINSVAIDTTCSEFHIARFIKYVKHVKVRKLVL